jgi:glycosyltransferase involved in cell wall biosynthesis
MGRAADRRRPLRVVLVTGAYAPEISSGGLQCQMVARVLGDRVRVRVLTTATDPTLPRHAIVDDVAVSRVLVDVRSRLSQVRAAWTLVRELAGLYRDADVVHVHGYSFKTVFAAAFARIYRVPLVLSLHTAGFDEPAAIAAQGFAARWAFNAAATYLAVSRGLVDACLAAGVARDRVQLVPNGVDIERFRPAAASDRDRLRRRLGIPTGRPVVLFVGFFSREKQPRVLFDAWLRLQRDAARSSTLVFVGATRAQYFEVDERIAESMREAAQQEGVADRVILVDPTAHVEEYYRAADLFVLPSSREGLPVALLEAMASALPVVASRLPGATDRLVDDGRTGRLVTPGDVDAFATAMAGLLGDPDGAAAMGRAAREMVVSDFSADRTANGWFDTYARLVPGLA